MRSNMTASMFDLSMKDKSRTPFGKLKDKLKGKRGNGLPDTASAIIPSISHSPADSEEESNEKEKKKSKFKTLFSKPGLQKNNLSQSMSVLPTQDLAGRVRLRPSDFQSKWGDDDEDDDDDTLTPVSEKPFTNRAGDNMLYPPSGTSHKRTGSGDSRQLNQITGSNTKKESHSLFGLKSKNDPTSRSNVCINGSHIYVEVHESKSDASLKDSSPSSPQISQRKRLFLSQENLSSDFSKEPENTGRFSPDKGPPGSSSLESFKAMTLPSYKLLSGGDLLESHNPVISDTPKETKESKKQENKKSGLLSLVTGRKEGKMAEEAEKSADASPKTKEGMKRDEKEVTRKEVKPFEVPVSNRGKQVPEKSSVAKASLNPFDESGMEEEKAEKHSVPLKPSQTKPGKPKLGVSSEDETKATSPVAIPSPPSLFSPSYRFANENNPFVSKQEQKTQDPDPFSSSLISCPAKYDNNPFVAKREQGSKPVDLDCSPAASSPVFSPAPGKKTNPFSPLWREESQAKDSEDLADPPLPLASTAFESHPLPCQPSNADDRPASDGEKGSGKSNSPPTSTPEAGNDGSKSLNVQPQNESLGNQRDSVSASHGAPSVSGPRVLLKSQIDDKVLIVPPFNNNSGRMKKSVTFSHEELKDEDPIDSENEETEEDVIEMGAENDAVKPAEGHRRQGHDLDGEHESAAKPLDSAHDNSNPSENGTKASSLVTAEPPLPAPRVLSTLPKDTDTSKTIIGTDSLSVPPKPAPRTKQKDMGSRLISDLQAEDALSTVFKKMSSVSSVSEEELMTTTSLAPPESTALLFGRGGAASVDPPQSPNNHSSTVLNVQPHILMTGDLNVKGTILPVIPEVGSDDEQLSECQQDAEKATVCGDISRNGGESREKELLPDQEVVDEKNQITSPSGPSGTVEPRKPLVSSSAVRLQNEKGLEKNNAGSLKEDEDGCPEFSDRPVSVSDSSQSYSIHSFQSRALGSNSAESPKIPTTEGLDAKVEISGQKKLLQARVSPSETHPNLPLLSGGTYPAKIRLHPVKPMNSTTNKPPAKASNTTLKVLDNQNEVNPKKYDPSDPAYAYAQLTHDELIQLVLKQKDVIAKRDHQVRELEDYIDNLLVRVMEETPNILRVQAHMSKKAGKM